jgi:hypothetical protein
MPHGLIDHFITKEPEKNSKCDVINTGISDQSNLRHYKIYYIHFEINGDSCNLFGSQECDFSTNHSPSGSSSSMMILVLAFSFLFGVAPSPKYVKQSYNIRHCLYSE